MDRTPGHIDDLFRKRLHDVAPPPPAFVWENVERELRKRRRRFFFWIFSFGIAGAGILGLWFANTTNQRHTASDLKPTVEKMQSEGLSSTETTLEQPRTALQAENDKIENTKPLFVKQTKTTQKGEKPVIPANIDVSPITEKPTALNLNELPGQAIETTPAALEAKPQKTFFEGGLLPQHQLFNISTGLTANYKADLLKKSWPVVLHPRPIKPKAKKPVKNCYDFTKQPNAWFIDLYAGPSLAQRELVSSPDDKPYLNKRLSSEHRDLAFNAGVRLSLMLKGNFLIRTGAHYDQMTEVFEFLDPNFKQTTVIITELPDGTIKIDSLPPVYGEKYQKTFNRFGILDIPLSAGVELRKGRSGFSINAGMNFNILFWKRGAILSPDTSEPTWFTPGKKDAEEVFRPRTGLSATASVQWFYHVKPRLRVFVEPYFKKVLRPVTLASHPVEQRYGIGGLRLGLTKILD